MGGVLQVKKTSILALFPHKLNCVKKLRKVRPEDFDAQALLAAAQEGRLYIKEVKEDCKDNIEEEVRAYVNQIRTFATSEFRPYIDDIWGQILACVLREAGVYQPYTDLMFTAQLELTGKDNSYRCYLGKGIEQRPLFVKIRKLLLNKV